MPQRMSVSPSCHRQVLLRFLIVSFPAPRFLCHGFRENFKIFSTGRSPIARRRVSHIGYISRFFEIRQRIPKKTRFFRHHPRRSSRPHHLPTGYIGKKICDPAEIFEKIVTFHADDRTVTGFAHRVYLETNTKIGGTSAKKIALFSFLHAMTVPVATAVHSVYRQIFPRFDRDSRKNRHFLRRRPPCGWFHTQGISGDEHEIR